MENTFTYQDYKRWQKKRQKTFVAFCILICCLGTEYSIIIPSLWFYVEDIEKNHTEVYYGVILSVYYVSAILGSLIITKYVDKTRNVRKTMIVLILCEIIGNVLYSIPESVYFLIIGRFIQGLGDVNMSIMTAEVARSYAPAELTGKISVMVACFSTMFVIAPAFNIGFKYIDFKIGRFSVYFGNLPGIFMILVFSVVLAIVVATVSDLSKEFELKENLKLIESLKKRRVNHPEFQRSASGKKYSSKAKKTSCTKTMRLQECHLEFQQCSSSRNYSSKTEETIPLLSQKDQTHLNDAESETENRTSDISLFNLITSFDYMLLVTLGFFMSFGMVGFLDVTTPILASKYFGFTSQKIGLLFFCTGVMFIIVLQIVKFLAKRINEYYLLFGGLAVFLTSIILLIVVSVLKTRYWIISITIFCSYVLLLGTCSCIEQVLLRSLLCKIVPSSHQSFGEGLRRSVSSMACIISSFVTPLATNDIIYLCIPMIAVIVFCIFLLAARRKTLMYPKLILSPRLKTTCFY